VLCWKTSMPEGHPAPHRESPGPRSREFFDRIWRQGDFWRLESSEFEQARYRGLVELLGSRTYTRALEIGCGAGAFTELLAGHAERVVAIDVSSVAIARARRERAGLKNVDFRTADVMDFDLGTTPDWDLIVLAETIYYLGWLYPFFDVAWLAVRLYEATSPGGRLMLANTVCHTGDYLLRPWVIRTYHDLFRNVGYSLETEEVLSGVKDGIRLETLVSSYRRSAEPSSTASGGGETG
jgi:cyclopropane fatty-acyl-phospholipid synthase-like methyltransferase